MVGHRTGVQTGELNEVSTILRTWFANRDSDSIRVQNLRSREMRLASSMLDTLVYRVQPEDRIILKVGPEQARASSWHKGAYDFYSEYTEMLEPESSLIFEITESYFTAGKEELYAGDWCAVIGVSSLAKTLFERSKLEIVSADEANAIRNQEDYGPR